MYVDYANVDTPMKEHQIDLLIAAASGKRERDVTKADIKFGRGNSKGMRPIAQLIDMIANYQLPKK